MFVRALDPASTWILALGCHIVGSDAVSHVLQRESPARAIMPSNFLPIAGEVQTGSILREHFGLEDEDAISVPRSPPDH